MNRQWLSETSASLGLARGMVWLRARTLTPWITVVTYHRVDPAITSMVDLDPGLVTATVEELDWQLGLLKEAFNVIDMKTLLDWLRGGPLPRSPLLITFDDGYQDNVDCALPLLQKHGLVATFFIATSFVERRKLFWWDELYTLIRRSRQEALCLDYPKPMQILLGGGQRPLLRSLATGRAHLRLTELVKTERDLDLERFLDAVARAAHVDRDDGLAQALARTHVMSWDGVHRLAQAGMDVESHTSTHRVVQTISGATLERELVESRNRIEDVLGRPVRALAYPVGRAPYYDGRIRGAVARAGYEVAFSNRAGINPRMGFDRFDVRRIDIEREFSRKTFEGIMAFPGLAHGANV